MTNVMDWTGPVLQHATVLVMSSHVVSGELNVWRRCTFYTHSGRVLLDACDTVSEARLWLINWGRGLSCAGAGLADGLVLSDGLLSAPICREVVRARAAWRTAASL